MLTLLAIVSVPAVAVALALTPAVCLQLLLNRSFRVVAESDDESSVAAQPVLA